MSRNSHGLRAKSVVSRPAVINGAEGLRARRSSSNTVAETATLLKGFWKLMGGFWKQKAGVVERAGFEPA